MESIILASASPRRKELLQQINMEFQVVPSQCEETIIGNAPEEIVQELARQKAEEVVQRLSLPGRIVLGADTVVAFENQILGKPSDRKEALEMIRLLQGKEHQVYTGVCLSFLQGSGEIISRNFYEKTSVIVNPMSEAEINAYIDGSFQQDKESGLQWADKAGAYGIQGCFAAFIKEIRGDYNNVVGLPISRVYEELKVLIPGKI
ncbi:MAG: septum formation protein Maf [Lachnospiraceae bacterium]|nr:septum formation protein Maf [Lachnospiraceae bacterium]